MVTQKPQWWQIYVLGAVFAGMLLLAHFAFSDVTARHVVQIVIVLVCYGVLLAWLGSRARVFEREDQARRKAARDVNTPIAERQAFHRLALSHRDAQLQKRNQ